MQYYRSIERTIPLGHQERLYVENRRGELTIFGEDREDIALTAQVAVNADSEGEGQERLDDIELPIVQEDGVVVIGTSESSTHHIGVAMWGMRVNLLAKRDEGDGRVDMVLRVPRRCALYAEQHTGPLRVNGVHAPVNVEARSGPLEVRNVQGRVELRARSGGVEVREVTGTVTIESRSGRVEVEHVRGDLGLRTRSGHVSVAGVDGSASLRSHSGRITCERVAKESQVRSNSGSVEFRGPLPPALDIETHSGAVRIAVARESPFYIDAETDLGSIRSELPVEDEAAPGRNGPTVRVRTHSGAIRIVAA